MKAVLEISSHSPNTAFVFGGDNLISCSFSQHSSFTGSELVNDTLTATVRIDDQSPQSLLASSEGYLLKTSNGNSLRTDSRLASKIYRGDTMTLSIYEDDGTFIKLYYYRVSDLHMIGSNYYQISGISNAAYYGEMKQNGFIYKENTRLYDVVRDISEPLLYYVSTEVRNIPVKGQIDAGSVRDALNRLQMVTGTCITGGERLESIEINGTAVEIPTSNCGHSVTTFPSVPHEVDVAVWGYSSEETTAKVLYDSKDEYAYSWLHFHIEDPYTTWEVIEYEPASLTYETIKTSGLGTPDVYVYGAGKLTVNLHKFTSSVISRETFVTGGKTYKAENNKLVNSENSENTMNKLFDFYCNAQKHEITIYDRLLQTNRMYIFTDADGNRKRGLLTDMDVNISKTFATRCTFISDFSEVPYFNFTDYTEYTTAQTIDIAALKAAGKTVVELWVYGAGEDGEAGADGEDGEEGINRPSTRPPEGGKGGLGGSAGKGGKSGKLRATSALSLDSISSIQILAVGANYPYGTVSPSNANTVVLITEENGSTYTLNSDEYSEESSMRFNPLANGGKYYGSDGTTGVPGAHGGYGYSGGLFAHYGGDVGNYRGGYSSDFGFEKAKYIDGVSRSGYFFCYEEGGGGGAAFGANGHDFPSDRTYEPEPPYKVEYETGQTQEQVDRVISYRAGDGADAASPIAVIANIGNGGNGGNGGGGGGGGGRSYERKPSYEEVDADVIPLGGYGGQGSAGSSGGTGGVIMFTR